MRTKVLEKKPMELLKRTCIKAVIYYEIFIFQFSQIIATLCFLFNGLINIQRCVFALFILSVLKQPQNHFLTSPLPTNHSTRANFFLRAPRSEIKSLLSYMHFACGQQKRFIFSSLPNVSITTITLSPFVLPS